MRLVSVIVAVIVAVSLYYLIVDRNSLIYFLKSSQNIKPSNEVSTQVKEKKLNDII